MPGPGEELDCVRCGACCFGHRIFLEPEDEARLSADEVLALTKVDPDDLVREMRLGKDGRCAALRVEAGRYLCSIYERRPGVCVLFERGGRRCLEWRERLDEQGGVPRK